MLVDSNCKVSLSQRFDAFSCSTIDFLVKRRMQRAQPKPKRQSSQMLFLRKAPTHCLLGTSSNSSHHCKYGVNVVHVCVSHSSAYLSRLLTSCTGNMDALPESSFNLFDAYPCFNIIDRSSPSHGWSGLGLGSLRKINPGLVLQRRKNVLGVGLCIALLINNQCAQRSCQPKAKGSENCYTSHQDTAAFCFALEALICVYMGRFA